MTFELRFASDWDEVEVVELNTIEDVKELFTKYDDKVSINFKTKVIIIEDEY